MMKFSAGKRLRGSLAGLARRVPAVWPAGAHPHATTAALAEQPDLTPTPRSAREFETYSILAGLASQRPSISVVYLYDAHGSALFEQICETPEYYLTRTEDSLLRAITPDLLHYAGEHGKASLGAGAGAGASATLPPTVWIECSAGNGQKVAPLVLESAAVRPTTYVPMDVSASALSVNLARFGARAATGGASSAQAGAGPDLAVHPLVGTNEEGLEVARRFAGRKTYMLLGSSLGNAEQPHEELATIARHMEAGDRLLVGVDTPPSPEGSGGKTEAEVVAAYNDAAGITAAFTLNALTHINRVAGTDFQSEDWRAVSEWCPERQAILAHVEARRAVRVTSADRELILAMPPGGRIFIEQSAKLSLGAMRAIARRAGMRVSRHWLSARDYYLIVECELLSAEERARR
jgi:uncharacterized SAM-dependent methyltransferase